MWTGSVGAAAGDALGVFCGPGAPSPGLDLRRRKRGSRMSPCGGGSERERGGGGRRRRARATTTSEAAAVARAAAQARARPQVSVAEDGPWAGEAGGSSLRPLCRPSHPSGPAWAAVGTPPPRRGSDGGAWSGRAGARSRPLVAAAAAAVSVSPGCVPEGGFCRPRGHEQARGGRAGSRARRAALGPRLRRAGLFLPGQPFLGVSRVGPSW